jgi:DNA-binding GntR family transcriptional regulator
MSAQQQTPLIHLEPAANQVANVLRQWIVTGRLAAGRHIKQEAIAEELGVSRVPVREAFVILEAEGIIVREKYKGAFVAKISLAEIKETYLLRDLLESFLFEKALPLISEDDLRQAENIIRQSDEAQTSQDWTRLNVEFQMTLYRPSLLSLTMQTLVSVLRRSDRYFRLQQAISRTLRDSRRDQHQRIVDVIRSGDHEAALQAMRLHIQDNSVEVIEYLQSQATADTIVMPPAKDPN